MNTIKVPEQIALMGFSNWFYVTSTNPKLSTIDQPSHEMGKESFNLLGPNELSPKGLHLLPK
jgi:LacI family transcriptional regulator